MARGCGSSCLASPNRRGPARALDRAAATFRSPIGIVRFRIDAATPVTRLVAAAWGVPVPVGGVRSPPAIRPPCGLARVVTGFGWRIVALPLRADRDGAACVAKGHD